MKTNQTITIEGIDLGSGIIINDPEIYCGQSVRIVVELSFYSEEEVEKFSKNFKEAYNSQFLKCKLVLTK